MPRFNSDAIVMAFHDKCTEAKQAETWYCYLYADHPYYGGPEEGGWWGTDQEIIAFQEFPSEELARAAQDAAYEMAKELTAQSRAEFGEFCNRQLEWLEARGLDSDFLGEVDGESTYGIGVSQEVPQSSRGSRHYS